MILRLTGHRKRKALKKLYRRPQHQDHDQLSSLGEFPCCPSCARKTVMVWMSAGRASINGRFRLTAGYLVITGRAKDNKGVKAGMIFVININHGVRPYYDMSGGQAQMRSSRSDPFLDRMYGGFWFGVHVGAVPCARSPVALPAIVKRIAKLFRVSSRALTLPASAQEVPLL